MAQAGEADSRLISGMGSFPKSKGLGFRVQGLGFGDPAWRVRETWYVG